MRRHPVTWSTTRPPSRPTTPWPRRCPGRRLPGSWAATAFDCNGVAQTPTVVGQVATVVVAVADSGAENQACTFTNTFTPDREHRHHQDDDRGHRHHPVLHHTGDPGDESSGDDVADPVYAADHDDRRGAGHRHAGLGRLLPRLARPRSVRHRRVRSGRHTHRHLGPAVDHLQRHELGPHLVRRAGDADGPGPGASPAPSPTPSPSTRRPRPPPRPRRRRRRRRPPPRSPPRPRRPPRRAEWPPRTPVRPAARRRWP